MRAISHILLLFFAITACQSQTNKNEVSQKVGGPCEGCEAIFEYGNKNLTPTDTLPDFEQTEPKLKLTGTVFQKDGKTPAANVILYIYHTDRNGVYPTKGDEKDWAKRHGYIRGWIKTNNTGKYTFYTFRPASYPNTRAPQHIHITVKEPTKNEYYIDEFLFGDDPNLSPTEEDNSANRGGSGIVKPDLKDGILTAKRDIVLGLNIPDYQ